MIKSSIKITSILDQKLSSAILQQVLTHSTKLASNVIAIVGLTATGKTKVTQRVIHELCRQRPNRFRGFCIVSADSRQVYRGLEITTGADVPSEANLMQSPELPFTFFEQTLDSKHVLQWHGTSIIPPTQSWSVAEFRELALTVFAYSMQRNYLVFVIGGTGLYHQSLADQNLNEMSIKPDPIVRAKAETLTLHELQSWLAQIDQIAFDQLNESDRMNPRRLVRHIEKKLNHTTRLSYCADLQYQLDTYGTQLESWDHIEANIAQRVKQRIQQGALQEVGILDYAQLDPQARTTLGLKEIHGFLESQYDLSALEQIWTLHEKQYAKRQLTWWKKRPEVQWFNPLDSDQVSAVTYQIIKMTDQA